MAVRRWLPLSGVVFVVLAVIAVVAIGGNTPDSDASGDKVLSFYSAHNVKEGIAAFVFAASVPFLVLFGISLAEAVSPAAGRRTVWEWLLLVGTAVAAAALLVSALIHFALADAGDQAVSPAGIQALNVLDADSWLAWNSGLGVMMLGAGASLLTAGRLLPRWVGWAALVLGILLFIPFADFFALLATLVWIIVASVLLFRSQETSVVAATPRTP